MAAKPSGFAAILVPDIATRTRVSIDAEADGELLMTHWTLQPSWACKLPPAPGI
jgi:hypothetical protein